jgi:hypothetical protein
MKLCFIGAIQYQKIRESDCKSVGTSRPIRTLADVAASNKRTADTPSGRCLLACRFPTISPSQNLFGCERHSRAKVTSVKHGQQITGLVSIVIVLPWRIARPCCVTKILRPGSRCVRLARRRDRRPQLGFSWYLCAPFLAEFRPFSAWS